MSAAAKPSFFLDPERGRRKWGIARPRYEKGPKCGPFAFSEDAGTSRNQRDRIL